MGKDSPQTKPSPYLTWQEKNEPSSSPNGHVSVGPHMKTALNANGINLPLCRGRKLKHFFEAT